MKLIHPILKWLETHWVVPAYGGWVLSGLVIFFFGAATNTMAGWLYVISGTILALLVIAGTLSPRSLRLLTVERRPIEPIMAGDTLTIRIDVHNHSSNSRDLIQIQDDLPSVFNHSAIATIETLPPKTIFPWSYQCTVLRRGVFRWHTIQLKTAAPLGLFWCCRQHVANAKAIVYPTILNLSQSSLLDAIGQETHAQQWSRHNANSANEGLTRALRPYRWGDPTRLIHWRTSARYGELRVRELELLTSSPSIVLAIDTAIDWNSDYFEQAAIAAASLYNYARRQQMNISVWTAQHGEAHTPSTVYEVLAAMRPQEGQLIAMPSRESVVWLTQSVNRLNHIAQGSRWILWPSSDGKPFNTLASLTQGLVIDPDQDLRSQLLAPLTST